MQYISVVIDHKSEYVDAFFTYRAPESISTGDKVTVAFGKRQKPYDAYVVETGVTPDIPESKIHEIRSVDPARSLNQEMIETALWMRRRYGVKYIDAIRMFTVNGKREKKELAPRAGSGSDRSYALTEEQEEASARIEGWIRQRAHHAFLIKGVTSSGKTEVYMRAVEEVLKQGRSAIVLVPEIALASQTEKRFQKRFGEGAVAVLHSKLTTSKRLREWLRIRNGEAKIVIGARTAAFAPIEDIGVIVIDEEHESTYKSDHNPKYETVDVAYKRSRAHDAVLILGSATPSIVSYYRAGRGIYELIEMKKRALGGALPSISVVDMREEAHRGNYGILSEPLIQEMKGCLSRKEQIILFLNRRGFSPQILCLDCGNRYSCEECGIGLTYHKSEQAAICHYCGRKYPLIRVCPVCGSKYIRYAGAGTERVEETIGALFPGKTIRRFDLDSAKSQKEIDETIRDFRNGTTDILIGTQILAKGLDFRNVGLVGVILADVSLNIPDYRSTERTFQLITQVAGRAGRDARESRVIIQTYVPEDESIVSAAAYDYERFYRSELLHRNIMNYPPFSDIIAVSLIEKEPAKAGDPGAMAYASDFRERLLTMRDAPKGAILYKPREDSRPGASREQKRVTFLIKAPMGTRSGYIQAYMDYRDQMIRSKAGCYIEIDVNPYGIV